MDRASWRRLLVGDFSFKRLVRSILLVYVLFGVIIFFAADRMMFYPEITAGNEVSDGILIPTPDDELISAIYRPAATPEYTILLSHGNAEAIADMEYFIARLNALGFSVLAYDYRGYGTSEGKPSEANTYQDIDAAFGYLTRELKVPADRVIAYGRSIGGGPSTDLAAREAIAGLILESTFVSAFRVRTGIPILPFDKFRNLSKLEKVRCPVLIMHSLDDAIIPIWHGKALFDNAPSPKRALWVEEGGHGGIPFVYPERYKEALATFTQIVTSGSR